MKKISSKILIIMIGCCILISLLIGGFSLYQGSKFIRNEASDKLIFMASSYANEFSQSIERTESYVDSLHSSVIASFDMEAFRNDPYYYKRYEQEIDVVMQKYASNNNDAFGMYLTLNPEYTKGEFIEIWYEDFLRTGVLYRINSGMCETYPEIFKDGWIYPCTTSFDKDEEGMRFLYDTIDARKPLWFKPYQEIGLANTTLSDITVISYVVPIIIEDTVIGVVGMDYNFDEIQKTIQGMNAYEGGYAFLIDSDYNILVQPDSAKDVKNLDGIAHLIDSDSEAPSGIVEYGDGGMKEIIGYSKLSNGWTLVLVQMREEIFKPAWELSIFIAILAFISIVITAMIANSFTKSVSRRFDSVTDQLHYMEIGDFDKEIPAELLKSDDDLGYFVKSVHTMQTIIKDLMKEIENQGTGSDESTLISDAVEKTQDATSKAAFAIEQISIERVEKEENLRDTLQKLEELNFKLQATVDEEVQKNREKDAALLYQSRYAKMGEMIGNIAHQWRQPLNSLAIILSELKDAQDHEGLDATQFEAAIEKSNQIIQSMSQTINDFRNFLNPSKQKTSFSLHQAVKFSANLMEESIRSNNISLHIELIEDSNVFGYENEFSQVVSNIINNAKDALQEIGDRKRTIRIRIRKEAQCAQIDIFNNGKHIQPEVMAKMFTPYFTTKTLESGTGIGLYMSKIIIEEHMKGEISFQNVEDGVCFRIMLPLSSHCDNEWMNNRSAGGCNDKQ